MLSSSVFFSLLALPEGEKVSTELCRANPAVPDSCGKQWEFPTVLMTRRGAFPHPLPSHFKLSPLDPRVVLAHNLPINLCFPIHQTPATLQWEITDSTGSNTDSQSS